NRAPLSIGPSSGHRHTRGLRASRSASVVRTVKAACRASEESSLEAPSNRQDLSHDRHRHLLRRLRADRQPDRAVHSRNLRLIRDVSASGETGEQHLVTRAWSEQADVRGIRFETETKTLLIALDVMIHDEHEVAGTDLHAPCEFAGMRGHERG